MRAQPSVRRLRGRPRGVRSAARGGGSDAAMPGWFDNPAEDAEASANEFARFPQALTALFSGDDFMNGQKTPCLRTARTADPRSA
jgi:hypothetical protein